MDKLIKIWKLKDNITNIEMVFSCRDDACDFEHSDTIVEEGYFVTKDNLQDVYFEGWDAASSCVDPSLAKAKQVFRNPDFKKYVKDLGVE